VGRKEILKDMKAVLLQRRDALRKQLAGDDSLLKQMNQDSVGDVIDFASDSAFGELSSQLAEVASRELAQRRDCVATDGVRPLRSLRELQSKYSSRRSAGCSYATTCIECQRQSESDGNSRSPDWGRLLPRSDDYRLTESGLQYSLTVKLYQTKSINPRGVPTQPGLVQAQFPGSLRRGWSGAPTS
jgi:RNA polymerase-binding transcription factor DksA